jgi:hypothetical protein
MPKQKIFVNKIPLTAPPLSKSQKFSQIPTLYLELIENKAKIKPSLVNKEYQPPDILTEKVEYSADDGMVYDSENSNSPQPTQNISERNNYYSESEDEAGKLEAGLFELKKKLKNLKGNDEESSDKNSNFSETLNLEDLDSNEKIDSPIPVDLQSNSSNSSDSKQGDDLGNRLNKLLDSDYNEQQTPSSDGYKSSHKPSSYKTSRSKSYSRSRFPPTLAELEKQGVYEPVRHLEEVEHSGDDEQDEEDLKREMLFKFELLKKSYTGADVPDFSIHSDYKTMTRTYENCVKRLSLDSSVDSYKQYLIYGFLAVELGLSYFFKFDMHGFTKHQIMNMNSYEKLLVELGEKSYVPGDSDWPVELRLLLLIVVNAAFFLGGKLLQNKTGSNIFGMIESMGNTVNTSGNVANNIKKRKMKGPEIDLDELPD